MDEKESQSAFMSALTTEHFVLQTAANATVSEAASRSSLYVISLSSALVAMGFASRSRAIFVPFIATVLPGVFLLGVFTVVRSADAMIPYAAAAVRTRTDRRASALSPQPRAGGRLRRASFPPGVAVTTPT